MSKGLVLGSFRFLDMSGCSVTHSPKHREDVEVEAQEAVDSVDGEARARRGFAKVKLAGEDKERWAKRGDTPIFTEAQDVFRRAQVTCRQLLHGVSIRVGSARAVPRAKYQAFEEVRQQCLEIAKQANASEFVKAANQVLGRQSMSFRFYPTLFPELRLSDPEEIARAELLRESIAQAIRLVVDSIRSGDRERIRHALDSVGSLADSVSDPELAGETARIMDLAARTIQAQAALAKAETSVARSQSARTTREAERRRAEAEALLNGVRREVEAVAPAAEAALSRWETLDLRSDAEAAAEAAEVRANLPDAEKKRLFEEACVAANKNDRPIEVETPDIGIEERAHLVATQLEYERRPRPEDSRFNVLEVE